MFSNAGCKSTMWISKVNVMIQVLQRKGYGVDGGLEFRVSLSEKKTWLSSVSSLSFNIFGEVMVIFNVLG